MKRYMGVVVAYVMYKHNRYHKLGTLSEGPANAEFSIDVIRNHTDSVILGDSWH